MNKRDKERETKISPRVLLRILILNAAFAQEERYITQTHTSFLSVQKFSRLNYVLKSLDSRKLRRKVNNDFGEEFKTFSFIT